MFVDVRSEDRSRRRCSRRSSVDRGRQAASRCAAARRRRRSRSDKHARERWSRRAKKDEQDGRWLAFRADAAAADGPRSPSRSPAGTPSAEGPNKTHDGAGVLVPHVSRRCAIEQRGVRLGQRVPAGHAVRRSSSTTRSTPRSSTRAQLAVSPTIPGMQDRRRAATGSSISGLTKARTTYKVDGLAAACSTSSARRSARTTTLHVQGRRRGADVLRPAGHGRRSIRRRRSRRSTSSRTNYEQLKVQLYKVAAERLRRVRQLHAQPVEQATSRRSCRARRCSTSSSRRRRHERARRDQRRSRRPRSTRRARPRDRDRRAVPWTESYEPPRMIAGCSRRSSRVDAYVDGDEPARVRDRARDRQAGARASQLEMRPFGITRQDRRQGPRDAARSATRTTQGRALPARAARRRRRVRLRRQRLLGRVRQLGTSRRATKQLAWYVIDDRKMYKPGEEVSLKGWLRTIDHGKGGDVGGARRRGRRRSTYKRQRLAAATRSRKGTTPVNAVGGFDTKFTLPKTPNLGYANVQLDGAGPAWRARLHARLPDRGVPPARVRGVGAGEPGPVPRRRRRRRHRRREVLRRRRRCPARRSTGTSPRARRASRRRTATTTCSARGSRGGAIAAGTTTTDGGGGYKPPKTWNHAGKTDATRRAHAAHGLPVGEAGDADVGDRERERHRRQPPGVDGVGGADRAPVGAATSGSRRRGRSSRRARRSTLDVIGVDLDGKAVAGREDRGQGRAARLGVQEGQVHDEGGRSADVRGRPRRRIRAVHVRDARRAARTRSPRRSSTTRAARTRRS